MTTEQTAYCGHTECVQAVNEWLEAGRPEPDYERGTAGVMTHRSEVLFYARRDWLADSYETAVAAGNEPTAEQTGAFKMRDRSRRAREWNAARRRAKRAAA